MDIKFETIITLPPESKTNLNLTSYESDVLRKAMDLVAKKKEEYFRKEIQKEFEIKNEQNSLTIEIIKNISDRFCNDNSVFSEKIEVSDSYCKPKEQNDNTKDNISSLKKRIKYCKNPMEKKKLQQELNALYKEQKRGKQNK